MIQEEIKELNTLIETFKDFALDVKATHGNILEDLNLEDRFGDILDVLNDRKEYLKGILEEDN